MMNLANFPTARAISPPGSEGLVRPPALLSVEVGEDEEAVCIWSHTVDGRSVATGYRIVPKLRLGLRRMGQD
jgi:hypothetical protein